jgi:tetratricopeptide (TPR) repeat protein
MHAIALIEVGRLEDALVETRRAVELDAGNFTAHWMLVRALAALRRYDEALRAADVALAMSERSPTILAEVAAVHAQRGDPASADALYAEVRERARTRYIGWGVQGAIAASAGHRDEALALVRKAVGEREVYLRFWRFGCWSSFRSDPDGEALLEGFNRKRGRNGEA